MCQPSGTCGGEIIDMAQRLTQRVDAIVAGHSHALVNTVVNGIPIVEARATGQSIGVIDIPLEPRGVASREVRDVYTDSLPGDPEAARIANAAVQAVAARVNRTVATIAEDMRRQGFDYALGKLVADAMRAAGNADFAVMNQGGIRADLRKGPATYGDLFEISPFANYLYRVTAPGADVRRYLELVVRGPRPRGWISGATITYDTTRADGDRITAIELPGGRAFLETATYTVVINDFMLTGGNGFAFVGTAKSEPVNVVDLDALVGWVESRPQPVVAPNDVRLRVVPR
jgi:5'-nucleotidase